MIGKQLEIFLAQVSEHQQWPLNTHVSPFTNDHTINDTCLG